MTVGRRHGGHRISRQLSHTDPPVTPPYYIDSVAGSDSNSGRDTGHPWQTLAPINSLVLPAATNVFLKKGSTFTGPLVCGSSGTAGNPIVYDAYGTGAIPIIQNSANGIQSETNPNSQILISGNYNTVKNFKVMSTADHTINGTFAISSITRSGSTVTVTTTIAHTAVAGNGITITGTTAYNGVHTVVAAPTTKTLTFTQATGGTESAGTLTGGSFPGPWPGTSNISYNQGVRVTGGNAVIDGIEATSLWAGVGVESNVLTTIQNCFLHACNHMGHNTIKANDDSGCFGINLKGDNNVIQYNTIGDMQSYSFDFGLDGSMIEIFGSSHNVIRYNIGYDCTAMCESAKTGAGVPADDHEVAYNIYYLTAAQVNPDGTSHRAAGWTSKGFTNTIGPVLNTRLWNNLWYMPFNANGVAYNGSGDVMGNATTNPNADLVVKMVNNTIWAGRDAVGQISGNAVYMPGGSAATNGLIEHNNDIYGVHQMKGSSSTVDATDKLLNPVLTNPTTDFTPAAASPLIDAGSVDSKTAGYTLDYAGVAVGTPPNIGPYE